MSTQRFADAVEFSSRARDGSHEGGDPNPERCFEHFAARAGLKPGTRAYTLARDWARAQTDPLAIAIIVHTYGREGGLDGRPFDSRLG